MIYLQVTFLQAYAASLTVVNVLNIYMIFTENNQHIQN
jgi:hypothetical protein